MVNVRKHEKGLVPIYPKLDHLTWNNPPVYFVVLWKTRKPKEEADPLMYKVGNTGFIPRTYRRICRLAQGTIVQYTFTVT